ncbi:GNAT family acetyltransferase [Flavobacterium rivuli WB 3.3-2 = DSM 21788]|uniref:GNAT family acetyltransferase n=1 Tax=Flavobacterium rivuli WB 3.3-2 = DSM 21788 TaxID=1121895 RepID=A0A0A2LZI6_9FLAO|nr:GNAT family N-acetyltransferase [Flavobacterium rivuli]KGO85777.1 GNAT family acetyltransferase [Flavobacterium rivuli WB 3.3-2 = DSM 21788]
MSIQFKIKPFNELSVAELYQVLQLRSEVFVVEQNCVYQDIDGKDSKALHVLGMFEDDIVAYARLFAPGYYFDNASIGRVVINANYRDRKWGHSLMEAAIAGIKEHYGQDAITISAQLYLKNFYEGHGFIREGEEYLEDDIPHIRMNRN